jgi:hypothetical protein
MSKLSKNKISKKLENYFYFERERLIRMPGYREAWEKYNALFTESEDLVGSSHLYSLDGEMKKNEGVEERWVKVNTEMENILKQFRTTYMPSPDNVDDLGWMRAYNRPVNLKDDFTLIVGEGPTTKRHKLFKVDIWMDKGVIFHELSDWIDKEKVSELENNFKSVKFLNPKKLKRRFAVFDFRRQKPPLSYRNIVLKLLDLYGKRDPEKSLNLARRDYQEVFEIIYGIPYKEYKKEKIKPSDKLPCHTCPKLKKCNPELYEHCSEVDFFMVSQGVVTKQAHVISGKRDVAEWE